MGVAQTEVGAAKPRTIGKVISLCFAEHTVGSWETLLQRSTADRFR
jgi:hypothetical protein